jgi:hypothetical protein
MGVAEEWRRFAVDRGAFAPDELVKPIFDSGRPGRGDFGRQVIDFVEGRLEPGMRRDAK